MTIEVPFFCKCKSVSSHRFIITFLLSIHLPLRLFMGMGRGITSFKVSKNEEGVKMKNEKFQQSRTVLIPEKI